MFMSIGAAASYLGVSVVTLRRWDRSGVLKPACRTAGGYRRYDLADLSRRIRAKEDLPGKTVAYARVSSHDQREDLERQTQRLKSHCEEKGWSNPEVIQDLGSGLKLIAPKRARVRRIMGPGTSKPDLIRFGKVQRSG